MTMRGGASIRSLSIPQSVIDETKELFMSGCFFTADDINARIGVDYVHSVILSLQEKGMDIRSVKCSDGRVLYGLCVDEAPDCEAVHGIGEAMDSMSEIGEGLLYHIQRRRKGADDGK